jgi:hypothetical protein
VNIAALILSVIAFVPLDDRPVTRQLPQLLGRIAGVRVVEPPRALLGNYLQAGDPDAIIAWLNGSAQARAAADVVVSTDMLAYGGLVASRVPDATYQDAYFRLNELRTLRRMHPQGTVSVFGTIMRLAPTGVPAIGRAASFFAAYPVWQYLQDYANLHDPPLPEEAMRARHLRALIGEPAFQAYVQTRARDLAADMRVLELAKAGYAGTVVFGQDDAGPVGLHLKDVYALQKTIEDDALQHIVAVEPGADELGMALVARALARAASWTPRVRVRYSRPDGQSYDDPLEYAPIDVAIGSLIALSGGQRVDENADVTLYVRVPGTSAAQDGSLLADILSDERAGQPVAFADLTFLEDRYDDQARFAQALLSSGAAARLDAYASWNTNANTIGTALAESIAAGAGRRMNTYDGLAHREFTFNRMLDDYGFHDFVRPALNRALDAQGVADHTYLSGQPAQFADELNQSLLWQQAEALLPALDPGYHLAAMTIDLPWRRTFETEIDAALAPNY